MDALFEAEFSPLSDTGRVLSKCGKCLRYMKLISSQPSRLYCGTCEEIYYTPQKGTVKVNINSVHTMKCKVMNWMILVKLGISEILFMFVHLICSGMFFS